MFYFKKTKLFLPYVIRDEYHNIIDIESNAPEEAKEAFKEYKKIMEQARKNGYKL